MASFDRAMEFVFLWEGGYVDNPSDPGGETNFGISKRAYPDVDIKRLTKDAAEAIYWVDYWNEISGDQLPGPVAIAVMDFAVNSGVARASKTLQAVVGADQDGKIGPKTISLVRAATANRGKKMVAQDIVMRRADYLSQLVVDKPEFLPFLKGWMRRTHSLMAEVLS